MRIDQRNAGAAVTTGGAYAVDRWVVENTTTTGTFSAQQDSSVPAGFVNSLKVTITAADASLSNFERLVIRQIIEGNNVADLGWGTANAKTVTVSFGVRSSVTGTFGASLHNGAENRSYPFEYTISAADTWEQKSVTIAGDTTGTWLTTNGQGIFVNFSLGAASSPSGTANAWTGSFKTSTTGATNLVATNGATFYITGVQLEVGSVATPFERRPFGAELVLCQRYFSRITGSNVAFGSGSAGSTTNTQFYVVYPQSMRAAPTISLSDTQVTDFQASQTATTINGSFAGLNSAQINVTSSSLTQYRPYLLTGASASAYIQYSSEL
jgi:hypothetical protein